MAKEDDEIYVHAKGAYGLSSCVPASRLCEWAEEQKRIEEEVPFEEMIQKLLAIPLSSNCARMNNQTEGQD